MGRAARRRTQGSTPSARVVDVPLPMTVPDPVPHVRRRSPEAIAPLNELRRLRRRQEDLEVQLRDALDRAVLVGHTYAEVGQVLGITRQAARQRHLRRDA